MTRMVVVVVTAKKARMAKTAMEEQEVIPI
jgi:hypothetical protein